MSLSGANFVGRTWTAVPSAAYTAAPADQDILVDPTVAGLVVTLDLTAFVTAASVGVTVLGVDETSGKTWTIATIVALTAVGTTACRIHPNNPTAAVSGGVQTQQGQIPPRIRIHVTQGNANSTTYSVGVNQTN